MTICLRPNQLEVIYKEIGFGKSVLDLGCGDGEFVKELINKGNIAVGVDYPDVDLNTDRLPFKENSFDVVTCIQVLEHLENIHNCIREAYYVLKKDGEFIISLPNLNKRKSCVSMDNDHINDISKNMINKALMNVFYNEPVFLEYDLILKGIRFVYFEPLADNWIIKVKKGGD